jgi:hypothetical protein
MDEGVTRFLKGGLEVISDLIHGLFGKGENLEETSDLGFLKNEKSFTDDLFESWQDFVSKFK